MWMTWASSLAPTSSLSSSASFFNFQAVSGCSRRSFSSSSSRSRSFLSDRLLTTAVLLDVRPQALDFGPHRQDANRGGGLDGRGDRIRRMARHPPRGSLLDDERQPLPAARR